MISPELVEEDTGIPYFMKLSKISFWEMLLNYKKMTVEMKTIHLNFDKLIFTVVFRWFLTVNEKSTYIMSIFLILWKNIPVFLFLHSFSVLVIHVSIERLYVAKSSAAFFSSSLIALLQSLDRFLYKRFSLIVL